MSLREVNLLGAQLLPLCFWSSERRDDQPHDIYQRHHRGGSPNAAEGSSQPTGQERAERRDGSRTVKNNRYCRASYACREELRQIDRHPGELATCKEAIRCGSRQQRIPVGAQRKEEQGESQRAQVIQPYARFPTEPVSQQSESKVTSDRPDVVHQRSQ